MRTSRRAIRSAMSERGRKRTRKSKKTPYQFLHFGCWGNGECDMRNGTNGLSSMMKLLNAYASRAKFVSVVGDNYYPEKVKFNGHKVKHMNFDKFASGFKCLPQGVPIYMTNGNHEYDWFDEDNRCQFQNQAGLLTKLSNHDIRTDDLIHNHMMHLHDKKRKTLWLFMDTTIYDDDLDGSAIDCISRFYYKDDRMKSASDIPALREEQLERALNVVTKYDKKDVKYLFIMGHHPIACLKKKGDQTKMMWLPELLNAVVAISREFEHNAEVAYFCADLHHYQRGLIEVSDVARTNLKVMLNIHQYICGTGGAEQDPQIHANALSQMHEPNKNSELSSRLFGDKDRSMRINARYVAWSSMQEYGFLRGLYENNVWQFDFMSVDSDNRDTAYSVYRHTH